MSPDEFTEEDMPAVEGAEDDQKLGHAEKAPVPNRAKLAALRGVYGDRMAEEMRIRVVSGNMSSKTLTLLRMGTRAGRRGAAGNRRILAKEGLKD
ncbi:MAG: hypothetical protein ACD_51C00188G0002 [uncultured bacterium]|nr:MAG: hypothetical protein ACD_51C00188G0002 [uncultured bacterium]OGJ48134.1 MAG: hypothetical protein A2244_01445 [Candidatus Peregrinibacteria bacterium RIFOXYA2_FULL_41_18]OGJ49037.1 MAG: hypothetical protein A2344_00690 [Candidatus Peregrinibacteria bacterium RIFOXYB12_FULL_41_12]